MARELRADTEALYDIASKLDLAHRALRDSPMYSTLHAGDVRGKVPDAVEDFIMKNKTPRETLVAQLKVAHDCVEAAHINFGHVESCLVRALKGDD